VSERGPGRPRSEEVDRAILAAALDELAEHGVAGASMESIAARAGIAKTTLYRRWKNKIDLGMEALGRAKGTLTEPPGESLRGDLTHLVTQIYGTLWDGDFGRVMPRLAAEARRYPELARQYWDRHIARQREIGHRVLREAQRRGEIRADVDPDLAWEMMHGPANIRALWRIEPLTAAEIDQIVDLTLAALAPRSRG
jgi:AcrR family transcriptional regulator